jgi:hypothetical protein
VLIPAPSRSPCHAVFYALTLRFEEEVPASEKIIDGAAEMSMGDDNK